jgi:hypothetical protein
MIVKAWSVLLQLFLYQIYKHMFYNKEGRIILREVIDLRFNLEVHLIIEGTGMLSRGIFTARNKNEITNVAYQYIQNIKRETGYRTTLIHKVIIDGTKDITEEVKEIDNRHIPKMDDIFW